MDSEDSDKTGWMHRLIIVFAGHTCHFVGFVMLWLNYFIMILNLPSRYFNFQQFKSELEKYLY